MQNNKIKLTHAALKALLYSMIIVLAACSGNNERNRLISQVEALNSVCPVSMGASGHLESVNFDQSANEVVFSYELSRFSRLPNDIEAPTAEQKRAMASFLQGAEGRGLLLDFDRAGVDVVLSFSIPDQGTKKVRLAASEIHEMAQELATIDTVREELTADTDSDAGCWQLLVGEPFRLDSVGNANDRMVLYLTAPDTMDLSTSQALRTVRMDLDSSLRRERPGCSADSLLALMASGHLGLSFVISEESDSLEVTVDFTPAQVAAMR